VYLDAYGVLPPAGTSIRGAGETTAGATGSDSLNSGFIALLAGLEQTALYNTLTNAGLASAATSKTAAGLTTKLAPFLCPSDSDTSSPNGEQSRTSYRFNLGTGAYLATEGTSEFTSVTVAGSPSSGSAGNGPFKVKLYGDSTSGHPGDGFSNTLFFTEKRIGKANGSGSSIIDQSGLLFASGYSAQTGLNTAQKPGSTSTTASSLTQVSGTAATAGYFASSFHTNGVNSVFGDGAGKFINYSIDPGLWASLGTAAGGEAATPP
jgi:hypothetical protein